MQYTFERHSDTIGIFQLEGNLIGERDGMELTDVTKEELQDGLRYFVIDLSQLQHINSSGLGALTMLLTKIRKKEGELVLVQPSDYIRNLLVITKLDRIFTIYASVEDAVAALEAT